MARLYSNELKAVVVPENILDNPKNVIKDHCLTVQQFEYESVHKRNDSGDIYGSTMPVILRFTVRVSSPFQAKTFYQQLASNEYSHFSFLFNATYDDNQRLKNYDDGMVAEAFVVHVEESYSSKAEAGFGESQVMLEVKLLVRSVTYLGTEKHFKSVFIQ